jgi:serine phosphatase RsbU (regulator of sigma subunit)
VQAIVAGCATKSAGCVVNEIFKAVTEHAAGVDAFDDQTVVAIKVKSGPGKRK